MMLPSTHPKQYQDVKVTLMWWTAILLIMIGFLFYLFVLPNGHRQSIERIVGQIVSYGIIMGLSWVLSWFLIFFLNLHLVYDRYFTRWRFYYDLNFILPALVSPFTHKLDRRFSQEAEKNMDEFMKPFYFFVGDYEHDCKIKENLKVRFYEVAQKYWITQMNEIMTLFSLLITIVYYFVYKSLSLPLDTIVITSFIIIVFFLINHYAGLRLRESLRIATKDQIEDIHSRFPTQLEDQLKTLHQKFGLKYDEG